MGITGSIPIRVKAIKVKAIPTKAHHCVAPALTRKLQMHRRYNWSEGTNHSDIDSYIGPNQWNTNAFHRFTTSPTSWDATSLSQEFIQLAKESQTSPSVSTVRHLEKPSVCIPIHIHNHTTLYSQRNMCEMMWHFPTHLMVSSTFRPWLYPIVPDRPHPHHHHQ